MLQCLARAGGVVDIPYDVGFVARDYSALQRREPAKMGVAVLAPFLGVAQRTIGWPDERKRKNDALTL